MSAKVEIKNLHKRFGDNVIFENFNVVIEEGEFIAFSGSSGCGKTTLLNIIGGLEKFDGGSVMVSGYDVSRRTGKIDYYRDKVGFLFQNFVLIDNKTVEQNLEIIQKRHRTDVTISEALEKVGLRDKLKSKVYTLSGGEQQRVALARLMIKKCELILADEPTGSLDSKNANRVMEILQGLNRDGKTVVVVSHDPNIISYANRIIAFDHV